MISAAGYAQEAPISESETAQRVQLLLDSTEGDRATSPDRVVSKLIELGSLAVPALLAAGRESTEPGRMELISAALGRLDPVSAEKHLLALTAGPGEEPVRRKALSRLGEIGGPAAASLLTAQMADNHPRIKRSAELALIRLLRRHGATDQFRAVETAMEGVDDETRARVICCIGQTGSAEGMRLLVRSVGRWPALDHALVSAISQMPDVVPTADVVPALRRLLAREDEALKREVVLALGLFMDGESVGLLVKMLAVAPAGLGDNAHWALKRISGLELPKEEVRWRLWFEEETRWWRDEGEALLDTLLTGSDAEILDALRILARARLFRDRLRKALDDLLDHSDPRIRAAAGALLARFGFGPAPEAADITATLTAQGFVPIQSMPIRRASSPPAPLAASSGSSRLVPIVGCFLILALVLRIFGLSVLVKVIGLFKREAPRQGAITVRLKRKRWSAPIEEGRPHRPGR